MDDLFDEVGWFMSPLYPDQAVLLTALCDDVVSKALTESKMAKQMGRAGRGRAGARESFNQP